MKPNVILILLDGSRTDRLDISDEFVNIQKNGVLLNNVTCAYPYTFAAINAIFTGLFGKENGVNAYYKMFRLKDSVSFLPEILQKNGYFTSCDLISNKVISKRGFDVYQSHNEYNDDLTKKHPDLIRKSFETAKGKPIFTFLQFSRIHTVTVSEILKKYEWDDKNYYEKKEQNLINYDDAFHQTAKYAKIIKQTIDDLDKSSETILIFFSDHGTGIGERFGERNYGVFTFEETIRTFFLFIGSDILQNIISNKLLSSIQIFPTILDLCQIDSNSFTKVKSITSFLLGKSKVLNNEPYTFCETGGLQGPFPSPKDPNVFCIKSPKFKMIYYKTPNKWELYDLQNDPNEIKNIYGKELAIEKELQQKLLDWINR